jgi:hypothetical protein
VGEGEGKRKGLASGLLECCVFPKKNEAFMAQKDFGDFAQTKKKKPGSDIRIYTQQTKES